jgi:hypothetical protein
MTEKIFNISWESAMKPPRKGEVQKLFVNHEDLIVGVKKNGAFAGVGTKKRR